MEKLAWNAALVEKYNINGPRYTSYPTALELRSGFSDARVAAALLDSDEPLSLYLHIPFCHQLCYYCGCNKVVTRHQEKADRYLDALAAELKIYAPLTAHRKKRHLHLGGGTPTFLSSSQLTRLMSLLKSELGFDPAEAGEISIEIDPRSCSKGKLAHLRRLGFNRVSFGVQDFNQDVQIAINRVQPLALIEALVKESRALGYASINLDVVYGLPYQTAENFNYTLRTLIALNPDRVSMFSYAHLPSRFAAQRKIPENEMLQGAEKQQLLLQAIATLGAAGYQSIGMDHFARADDELAVAQREGRMQRNFQGYTTHGSDALLGLGVSSISQVNGVIWQHAKDLPDYFCRINDAQVPLDKGFELSQDDKIRSAVISQLICHFHFDFDTLSRRWGIDSKAYFAQALEELKPYQTDGLVEVNDSGVQVTALGRLWVRLICACFDAYQRKGNQFSKVV